MPQFERTNGQSNPETRKLEYLSLFEYSVTERRTRQRAEWCQGQWYNRNYWRTLNVVSDYGRQKGDVMKIGE